MGATNRLPAINWVRLIGASVRHIFAARCRNLLDEPCIQIGDQIYRVTDFRDQPEAHIDAILRLEKDGKRYEVLSGGGLHDCGCEDFQHSSRLTRRPCKHITAAYLTGYFTRHAPLGLVVPTLPQGASHESIRSISDAKREPYQFPADFEFDNA